MRESNAQLLHAITSHDIEGVLAALQHGAQANFHIDSWNSTPLHLACQRQCPTMIVDLLIQFGADVNARNSMGRSPLDWSIIQDGTPASTTLRLLQEGASPVFQRSFALNGSPAQASKLALCFIAGLDRNHETEPFVSPTVLSCMQTIYSPPSDVPSPNVFSYVQRREIAPTPPPPFLLNRQSILGLNTDAWPELADARVDLASPHITHTVDTMNYAPHTARGRWTSRLQEEPSHERER